MMTWRALFTQEKVSVTLPSPLPPSPHGRMNYKDTKPYKSAFLSVDLLTDFVAFCLTDFIDWRYIHSWFVFSTQLGTCCPHGRRNYTLLVHCCVAPLLYHLSDLLPPPPFPNVQYIQTLCDCGGVLKCTVDHILQEFYTLFLTRFRTYKIASPPLTKMTSKGNIKGLVS
jgi:hypothetical protein